MHKKFNELLAERNMTAYQVAKKSGLCQTTVYNFKNGKYTPKYDKIKKIASALGVSIDEFYGE